MAMFNPQPGQQTGDTKDLAGCLTLVMGLILFPFVWGGLWTVGGALTVYVGREDTAGMFVMLALWWLLAGFPVVPALVTFGFVILMNWALQSGQVSGLGITLGAISFIVGLVVIISAQGWGGLIAAVLNPAQTAILIAIASGVAIVTASIQKANRQ